MTSNNTEETKMYVVDGAPVEDVQTEAADAVQTEAAPAQNTDNINVELTDEEVQDFYEEHKDAIDLIGGLDMFESLMSLSDEDFEQLKPSFMQLFNETINDDVSRREILAMIVGENYTPARLELDYSTAIEAINTIDFLSPTKIDFLKEITTASINKMRELMGIAESVVTIPCELGEGISIPSYAHETDAGMDIYSPSEYTIGPGETIIIPTGIKVAIPDGYAILIQPRSGQSVKTKLRVANTPGLIDSGYRDEIGVIIENIEPSFKDIDYEFDDNGEIHIKSILHGQSYTIAEGQRFAQMRLVKVPKANFVQVSSVSEVGENRGGGFGSSGL
jgi:dUTP pyrophosphatase